ncbi:MAG TPA: phage major capsid protein [Candidatus Limnocylindrales bacterium]
MAYTNIISRTDAAALMPEDVANAVMGEVEQSSAAMQLFAHYQMPRGQTRIPVISALPIAYFVNGDTGLKQTTEVDWTNKYLNAEEIATIVPIPENVLDDSAFPIWDEIRPRLVEAVARTFDAAVFFGTNKPASWPSDIVTSATAAGNTVTEGTNLAAAGGISGDISDLEGLIEADGFDVNGFVAVRTVRGKLRQARSTQGVRLAELDPKEIDGTPVLYPMRGLWPTGVGVAELIAGDFSQGVVGIRRDITWKILDQAVIQDGTGAIQFNLAQQDMVALRLTTRLAFQVPNPIRYDQQTEANRYPFGILLTA